MTVDSTFWHTTDSGRTFLVPDDFTFCPGSLCIHNRLGRRERVDPESIAAFEVNDAQAVRLARDQLGETLTQVRSEIEGRLADIRQSLSARNQRQVNSATAPALLDFFKALPGVIGQSLSGEDERVDAARDTMARLQQRLRDAGIDVDDRVQDFVDRIASIPTDTANGSAAQDSGEPAPKKGEG